MDGGGHQCYAPAATAVMGDDIHEGAQGEGERRRHGFLVLLQRPVTRTVGGLWAGIVTAWDLAGARSEGVWRGMVIGA